MKKRTTFATLFWIYKSRAKNGKAPVYARITVNGAKAEAGIKRMIPVDLWDQKRGCAIGASAEAKELNRFLELIRKKIYDAYQDLLLENAGITAKTIRDRFLGHDEQKEEEKTLLELIDYHNERSREVLEWGTLKNYFTTKKYVEKFLKHRLRRNDIPLSELNFKFLTDFEYFLRKYQPTDHRKSMGNNTVMKHIERLKKTVNMAMDLEWITKDPFARFKKHFEKKDRGYLNAEELRIIEKKAFSIARIALVKDLFIFSCYTGLAYKDVMLLTPDHVVTGIDGNQWIATKRLKTSVAVNIPLLPQALGILQKYEKHPRAVSTGTLLPNMTNQKINAYLKEIADLCGIKKNLTFHLARHTFATTVTLTNGVPIETVSKLLGHTSIKTTQIYARIVETKLSNDMDVLRKKLAVKDKDVQIRKYGV